MTLCSRELSLKARCSQPCWKVHNHHSLEQKKNSKERTSWIFENKLFLTPSLFATFLPALSSHISSTSHCLTACQTKISTQRLTDDASKWSLFLLLSQISERKVPMAETLLDSNHNVHPYKTVPTGSKPHRAAIYKSIEELFGSWRWTNHCFCVHTFEVKGSKLQKCACSDCCPCTESSNYGHIRHRACAYLH